MLCFSRCHVFDLAITSAGRGGSTESKKHAPIATGDSTNWKTERCWTVGHVCWKGRSERDRTNMRWWIEKYGRTLTLPRVEPYGHLLLVDASAVFSGHNLNYRRVILLIPVLPGCSSLFRFLLRFVFGLEFGGHSEDFRI